MLDDPRHPAPDPLAPFGFDDDGDRWMATLREAETPLHLGSIGAFELLEEISRGGQGVVYRARETHSERPLAVKRLLAGSLATPAMRRRFEREVEAAASLDHPNIVTAFGVNPGGGQPVLAMEWIDGVPVTNWAADGTAGGRRPVEDIAAMMVKVCAAVHYAHQRGVIHRDLKPSNILVDAHGEPHVLDFGLAKHTAPGIDTTVTLSGQFVGTPAYASPEQVRGGAEATDVRSDVYALGVVFFEMLTGRMPYPVEGTLAETFDAIQRREPARPSSVDAALGREVDAIVLKTLAKTQAGRYASVDALGRDVQRLLDGEPVEAKGDNALYVFGKAIRRYRVPLVIAAILLVAAATVTVTTALMYQRSERGLDQARRVQQFLEETLTAASPYEAGGDVTVLEMLEVAAGRIDDELGAHPEAEAGVRLTIGQVYSQFWMWPQAEPHLRRALTIYEELYGPRHADVAAAQTLLGRTLTFLDRESEGVDIQRAALATRRRLFGDDHPLVAETTNALAFAVFNRARPGDRAEAERLYRASVDMYERVQSEPVEHWARALYSYAAFLASCGRPGEAEGLYLRSVEMYRGLSDAQNVYLVRCLEGYASTLARLGRYDKAEAILDESIARTPPGFGAVRLPYQLWSLGKVQSARGNVDAAEEIFRKSLGLKCTRLALRQPDAADEWNELGARLSPRGGSLPAPDVYLDVFTALLEKGGRTPHPVAEGLADVSAVRLNRGEAAAVEPLIRESLRLFRLVRPKDAVEVADAKSLLGVCLGRQGRFDEAEALLTEAVESAEAVFGIRHRFTAATRERLRRLREARAGG